MSESLNSQMKLRSDRFKHPVNLVSSHLWCTMYVMMEAKRQSNMTAVQAYTTGCKNSPGYGGKDSTFFRSWGKKKREKDQIRSL